MAQAGARAHALDFAGADEAVMAHVVLVFERAVDHVGDDFHLPVGMQREAAAWANGVVVKDAQRPELHVIRVMIVVEGEMPVSVKPIRFSVIAVFGANGVNHDRLSGLSRVRVCYCLYNTLDAMSRIRRNPAAHRSVSLEGGESVREHSRKANGRGLYLEPAAI